MDATTTTRWDDFIDGYVVPVRTTQIQALHSDYIQQKESIAAGIVRIVDEVCIDAVYRQSQGEMGACAFIRISWLRTPMLYGKMTYVMEALDEEAVQGYPPFTLTSFNYEATWIVHHLAPWVSTCHGELIRHRGGIAPSSWESWIRQGMAPFQEYMVHAVRYAINRIQKLVSYQTLLKAETFEMVVGEYGDATLGESVYLNKKQQKSDEGTQKLMQSRVSKPKMYSHLTYVDLSAGSYGARRWNYLRAEQVNFSHSNMRESVLIGIKFEQCNCQGCDFSGSTMYDADFRDSDLSGACLDHIIGERDQMNATKSKMLGLYGMQFQGANLSGASFREARVAGDFRYAHLEGVDFTGADLTGSTMLVQDGVQLHLSEDQMFQVTWLKM
ncbi:Pentapeptide repeats (8 copies) [compost metagenome]